MRSSLEALKSAGIEFVVFLSSYTIGAHDGEPRNVPQSDIIPYMHAQVEINLHEVFGPERYVVVRPGGFATNLLRNKNGIAKGEARVHGGNFKMDYITPVDMGKVSGTILATQTGPRERQREVYLFGPQVLSLVDAIGLIGKVLGKEVKITEIDAKEAMEQYEANHVPKPLAEYLVRKLSEEQDDEQFQAYYDEGVRNVQLYTAKPATTLKEWVEDNKELFSV